MDKLQEIITQAYHKKSRNLFTFLTGAGISADSGIPTYRGSDGIWINGSNNYRPEEFGTLKHFMEFPEEVWRYTLIRKKMFQQANPNASHFEIAKIEELISDRFWLITQNIDGLHSRSGSNRLFEIHGNLNEVKCSNGCKGILPFPSILNEVNSDSLDIIGLTDQLKCDSCGGWLRPNILWFDENYYEITNKRYSSLNVAKNSAVVFIIGSSGATTLPCLIAKTALKYGATVIDINMEDNQFTEIIKDKKRKLVIRLSAAEVVPAITKFIQNQCC